MIELQQEICDNIWYNKSSQQEDVWYVTFKWEGGKKSQGHQAAYTAVVLVHLFATFTWLGKIAVHVSSSIYQQLFWSMEEGYKWSPDLPIYQPN